MSGLSGKQLLTSLLVDDNGASKYLAMGLSEDLFPGPELELFEQIDDHIRAYGSLPKPATVGIEIPESLEPPAYYFDDVVKRFKHRSLVKTIGEVQAELTNKDPLAAEDLLRDYLVGMMQRGQHSEVVDFASQGAELLDAEYLAITKGHLAPGIMTGYPTLDSMLNGLKGGDVMSVVGRPGQGKTYQILRMAHHAWHQQKKKILFVSMEMKPLPLVQRITAMHEKMSITLLRKGEIMKEKHAKIMANMHELETSHNKFWIVDGNLASEVEDIAMLARQMQPDAVFIDGAYLMKSRDRRLQKHERIANGIETVKSEISTSMDIPVILTYQFSRAGAKDKELENIGGSDAIGQISSCVLALYEKETNSIENIVRKRVSIMKGRNGEEGEFFINWLFDVPPFMDFSEITPEDQSEKEFVYV